MSTERSEHRPQVTLLLGGVRSGKSARAITLAQRASNRGRVLFVATAQAFDDDMARRIAAHRAERPTEWRTLEAPLDLPTELARALDEADASERPFGVVVIDCLTLWTSNLLLTLEHSDDAEHVIAGFIEQLMQVRRHPRTSESHWIIVSNEVGLGVVPSTALGRRYRDALGRANQLVAAVAEDVTLMVAGIEMPIRQRVASSIPLRTVE